MSRTLTLALCEGRHEFPSEVKGAIFGTYIEDPTDVDGLEEEAQKAIEEWEEKLFPIGEYPTTLEIYVTGMTVALIAVLNVARDMCFESICLYHYDKDKDSYYTQYVN